MPDITPLNQIYAQAPPATDPPATDPPPTSDPAQQQTAVEPAVADPQLPEATLAAPEPPVTPNPPAGDPPEVRARQDLERRDRELFQRETWLRQKMQDLQQYDQVRQLARDNPVEAARILGIDTLRLAEGIMGGGGSPQQDPAAQSGDKVMDYIKELRNDISELRGGFTRQTSVGEIKSALSASRDQYSMLSTVAETNPQFYDQLHALKNQYRDAGREVDLKAIFDQQEDFYTQSMLQSLTKVLQVPKLREKVAELINKQPGPINKPAALPAAPTAPQTLRNSMTSTPPTELPKPTTPEQAAIEARKFKLWAD